MKPATRFFITPRVILTTFVAIALMAFVGCQSSNLDIPEDQTVDTSGSLSPSEELGELNVAEEILYTDHYAGYLVVFVKEDLGIRYDAANLLTSKVQSETTRSAVSEIVTAVRTYPGMTLKPSVETDPDQLDIRRFELEQLSGKNLRDFNSILHVFTSDPDNAVRLMRALEDSDLVEMVYPKLKNSGLAIELVDNLTPHQGYLYANATHGGLNAAYGWSQGIYGQDVMIVDADSGWNFDHEDLPLATGPYSPYGCQYDETPPLSQECETRVAHGTAMAGIMVALDNGYGITGMAPDSLLLPDIPHYNSVTELIHLTDGANGDDLAPGTVYAIIVGEHSPHPSCTAAMGDRCVPLEVDPSDFEAIEIATAAGITVVSAASNIGSDLDDPNMYYPWMMDMSQNDSGSILVGSSQGANHQRSTISNYGSRVELYAWGENVATTSYPVTGIPQWGWLGSTLPVPPSSMDTDAYFSDGISGTSPATAQIAAAAALVQSYAKQVMGSKRFLMPSMVLEALQHNGVPQSGGGGNIGVQPQIDQAFAYVDQLWADWSSTYPELLGSGTITQQDLIDLRNDGLGLVCIEDDAANSDPACPDESLWIEGSGIADHLDFDGDNRADLVSWRRGVFKIDFSSVGGDADGFGAWDSVITYPEIQSGNVWPYVEDMNSDNREDLVLYDKENGTWYIAYTTAALIAGVGFSGWDEIITTNISDQYAMQPENTFYCRPHPGDYDGDGWVDLAVACSDGIWYIEANPNDDPSSQNFVWQPWSASVDYDWQETYLDSTQLGEAPGWAYMTANVDFHGVGQSELVMKVPDGVLNEGSIFIKHVELGTAQLPSAYGDNSNVLAFGEFTYPNGMSVGIKSNDGVWSVVAEPGDFLPLDAPLPASVYGGMECHPIAADFDGDGRDDRAVMCPDEWRIAYSGTTYDGLMNQGVRYISLGYLQSEFTLPGRSYSGGISYADALEIIDYFKNLYPNDPPPIYVDMVTIGTCDLIGGCQ